MDIEPKQYYVKTRGLLKSMVCREMWRKIQEVHPSLAEVGKFID